MLPSVPPDAGGHDDGTKLRRPVHSPSPEYDPAIERDEAEGIENRTVLSSQRYRAHDSHTVLNKGRCFITNRPTPVQSCHLVSQAIVRATLTKLEYVWEIGHGQFDLDTKHNVLHLRADWLTLFDDSRWILLPDVKIVEELKKIYLSDERPTSNLGKFENQAFQYYIVPAPSLRELICRFPDVDGHEHKTYAPRFSELGPLIGHIHPHHVIFNTGHKLLNRLERIEVIQMRRLLSQNLSITVEDAKSVLDSIEDLYTQWTKTKVPAKWYKSYAPSDGQDSSSFTDDSVVVDDDDTAWIECIHNWQKQVECGCGTTEGMESDSLNDPCDEQLTAYIDEHARAPPSPGAWDRWQPVLDDHQARYPSESDRSRFSSNDWAVFKNDVYLTRSAHPRVTL